MKVTISVELPSEVNGSDILDDVLLDEALTLLAARARLMRKELREEEYSKDTFHHSMPAGVFTEHKRGKLTRVESWRVENATINEKSA